MKESGILRKLDPLGRIVIPAEIRKVMGINEGDPLEIVNNNNEIVLKKYARGCVFCGNDKGCVEFSGTLVCDNCKKALKEN